MKKFTLDFMIKGKNVIEKFMMIVVKVMSRTYTNNLPQSVNIPTATYSPWQTDINFQKIFPIIKSHSLIDIYRLYENWHLVQQTNSIEGHILEVGVWRGGSGCLMAYHSKILNSRKKVFLCDTFEGVVKAGQHDNKYVGGEFSDTSQEIIEKLCDSLKLDNISILKGVFPEETGVRINELNFSLCHIDVDTYESAKDIYNWVWPKLSKGGIIIFDDYGFVGCEGVTKLVNDIGVNENNKFIHNLNGHAILIKLN